MPTSSTPSLHARPTKRSSRGSRPRAESLWTDDARDRVAQAAANDDGDTPDLDLPAAENQVALALAYGAALPLLARAERVQAPLSEVEPTFAELDEEDRERLGPARIVSVATPPTNL